MTQEVFVFPASFAQQRLWFLDQLQPGSASYNVSRAIRLSGVLNVEALHRALVGIVARHETLRTTFGVVDGNPVQIIAAEAETLRLPIISLSELAEAERQTEALRLATEEAHRPFDLADGPMLRTTLLRLRDEEHVLVVATHHIIFDGWSWGVFFRELAALYEAFAEGRLSPLQDLPIQYADFAMWQKEWLSGQVLERQLTYWKRQLGGAPALLQLPTDRARPPVLTNHGKCQYVMLPKELCERLKTLSRESGATLFMTLLAAYQILLMRYTEQTDIVVGTDVANRNMVEVEGLIGFFLNHLVMRTDMSGDPTFRDLLARVRAVSLEAYANQDVPFDKLVETLKPNRDMSYTPLFQVLFVLQNASTESPQLQNLKLSFMEFDNGMAKFDLALFMEETEHGLFGAWVHNTDLFDESRIKRMTNHFQTLLESIAAQPRARISGLEMLTNTEKELQVMERRERQTSEINKLRNIKRKTVNLSEVNPIKTSYIQPGQMLPLVIEPNIDDLNLAEWAKTNQDLIETELQKHGAVLFRGFDVNSVADFENFAISICGELFDEYGDLPREGVSGKVYKSTPYPADQAILFHNESSHMHRWPMKIMFNCVLAAEQGGETPIVDCRRIYQLLDPKIREQLADKGLMYVRNYTDGLDVSWQTFFHTSDKSKVEDYCRKSSIEFEWKNGSGLRTRQLCPAVVKHPKTGEPSFFNQIQLHHVSCLEPTVRESLLSMFSEQDLPRNVYYGDGSSIEDSVVNEILNLYWETSVAPPWKNGDIFMLDNMLVAHARNPFVGPRKIVVAMGEMINKQQVAGN